MGKSTGNYSAYRFWLKPTLHKLQNALGSIVFSCGEDSDVRMCLRSGLIKLFEWRFLGRECGFRAKVELLVEFQFDLNYIAFEVYFGDFAKKGMLYFKLPFALHFNK